MKLPWGNKVEKQPLLAWSVAESTLHPGKGVQLVARQLARKARDQNNLLASTEGAKSLFPTTPLNPEAKTPVTPLDGVHSSFAAAIERREVRDAKEKPSAPMLLHRFKETVARLKISYEKLTEFFNKGLSTNQAAEWFLDNYWLISEHCDSVTDSMPSKYLSQLPSSHGGQFDGDPRVFEMAAEFVACTSGVVTLESANAFIQEYQTLCTLKMGELWAFPVFLKMSLIASVERVADRTLENSEQYQLADTWAKSLMQESKGQTAAVRTFMGNPPRLTSAFVSRLHANLRVARTHTGPLALLMKFIQEEQGIDPEDSARQENTKLALSCVQMQNCITSLRTLSKIDMKVFFEKHSKIDRILRQDPIYPNMAFATRDNYRHVIEAVAKCTKLPEDQVAKAAIEMAKYGSVNTGRSKKSKDDGVERFASNATDKETDASKLKSRLPDDGRQGHVGYFLCDEDGLKQLKEVCGYKQSIKERIGILINWQPGVVFFGLVQFCTICIFLFFLRFWVQDLDLQPWSTKWVLLQLFLYILCNDCAISFTTQFITNNWGARLLPRMKIESIPDEFRTATVVPLLFPNVDSVKEHISRLEVQFLANRQPNVSYCLLSDYADAKTQHMPNDEAIIKAAIEGIEELNRQYPEKCFLLFHRERRFNRQQNFEKGGTWMGWERKRGKLTQFNKFLINPCEETSAAFSHIIGDTDRLKGIRFVITLDADTLLPRDAVRDLVGTMAHPLNQPIVDPVLRRVVKGYGILEPRVSTRLRVDATKFASIFSGEPGIDPYCTAVSDLWQDLFAEGSFQGKGIYDVHAFEKSIEGRFLENTILSHDLVEGSYARCGLVTDVELFDDFPANYTAYSKRKHRWLRGDIQLLLWVVPSFLLPKQVRERIGELAFVSKWKMFDNIRRFVVEVTQLLFFILGWFFLDNCKLSATLIGLTLFFFPWLLSFVWNVVRPPQSQKVSKYNYYKLLLKDFRKSMIQAACVLSFLPHQGLSSLDGAVRTVYRLFKGINLLEWVTVAQVEGDAKSASAKSQWMWMWDANLLTSTLCSGLLLTFTTDESLSETLGSLLAFALATWCFFAPQLSHYLSSTPAINTSEKSSAITNVFKQTMYRYALLHWRYFDNFVTEETSHLVPDNHQEVPEPGHTAMRTSPTNIAMQLCSYVAALDLGFISTQDAVERIWKTFESLKAMKKYRGHWLNWYDVTNLHTLHPEYVSTVDSGNLAAALVAIHQAVLQLQDEPLFSCELWCKGLMSSIYTVMRLRGTSASINKRRSEIAKSSRRSPGPLSEGPLSAAFQQTKELYGLFKNYKSLRAKDPNFELSKELRASFESLFGSIRSQLKMVLDGCTDTTRVSQECAYWLKWSITHVEQIMENYAKPTSTMPLRALSERAKESNPLYSQHRDKVRITCERMEEIVKLASRWIFEFDFKFLLHNDQKLFAIGFALHSNELDKSTYDLLASECRSASYIAVAKGDVPVQHYFLLGRSQVPGGQALISWSGTMFEYLMPHIFMECYPNTLLHSSVQAVVREQIEYAQRAGQKLPWGISESAFNCRYSNEPYDYMYRAFGVATLALKRGQERDYVVAPYASLLALGIVPDEAMDNLALLEHMGVLGMYGFRDAIDYTRPEAYSDFAVVHNYMAHHIGMGLLGLTNVLLDNIFQKRFHSHPIMSSASLLLHEKVPREIATVKVTAAAPDEMIQARGDINLRDPRHNEEPQRQVLQSSRAYTNCRTSRPVVAILGTVPMTVMVTNSGSGFCICDGRSLYRWRDDITKEDYGMFIYVRNLTKGKKASYSATYAPTCVEPSRYMACFGTGMATFERTDGSVQITTKVCVNATHNADVRVVTIKNNDTVPQVIELTSYCEVVLQSPAADAQHQSFGNLFVQTSWSDDSKALYAMRRVRNTHDKPIFGAQVLSFPNDTQVEGHIEYETDRNRFVGRGNTSQNPIAQADDSGSLSQSVGAVLDPIFSIRVRVVVPPCKKAEVAFTTTISTSQQSVRETIGYYTDFNSAQLTLHLASSEAAANLKDLEITQENAMQYQTLCAHLLYKTTELSFPHLLNNNHFGQETLWSMGISGDLPILLLQIESEKGLPMLGNMLSGHHYLRRKGIMFDVVIVNMQPVSYLEDLGDRVNQLVHSCSNISWLDKPGGVFIRRKEMIPPPNFNFLSGQARVHIYCDQEVTTKFLKAENLQEPPFKEFQQKAMGRAVSSLDLDLMAKVEEMMKYEGSDEDDSDPLPDSPAALTTRRRESMRFHLSDTSKLKHWNGYGGFTEKGDYEIHIVNKQLPPAPWSNVIGTPEGGCIVSESGGGFTFAENSFMHRLTPWRNDPVSDRPGEVIYIREDTTGEIWSCTPLPCLHDNLYKVTHSVGKTVFEHEYDDIKTELTIGMAVFDDTIEVDPHKLTNATSMKLNVLKITNITSKQRSLSVCGYVEWCMGSQREKIQHTIVTSVEPETKALCAQTRYESSFADRKAFFWSNHSLNAYTCDRREFLGRHGNMQQPFGLLSETLNETYGCGHDPCAARLVDLAIPPHSSVEIVFVLGSVRSYNPDADIRNAIRRYAGEDSVATATADINRGCALWEKRLQILEVHTPSDTFDMITNRWCLYQSLSCRVWARSAFYQSGGAFGFRDQLQDCMSVVYVEPTFVRAHLLESAQRQFLEGDVMHWYHLPTGRGVRTKISDDLLWLPFVTSHYLKVTGDYSVLGEKVPYIELRELKEDEEDLYDLPRVSQTKGTLYEHCMRTFHRACTAGHHGLPLIGSGDWNDGMNRVGQKGKGESVWLGWFIISCIDEFLPVCEYMKDEDAQASLKSHKEKYTQAVNDAWDGEWFRRAYFDDGKALGSSLNTECRIDSLSQSWSILSNAATPEHQLQAMNSVETYLVDNSNSIIKLLTPPFDKSNPDPGYIRGYLPGVRENGAQYTHAAVWVVLANARLGRGDRAFELFQYINPISHSLTRDAIDLYKVEPYVVAADVYGASPNVGRGGWTWYTGSASWLYRAAVEGILGLKLRGPEFTVNPCIPSSWPEFSAKFRPIGRSSLYEITVKNVSGTCRGVKSVTVDGVKLETNWVKIEENVQRKVVFTM